ncbi:hypothetical protein RvY_16893 [Ramazzottius varieornatus]|uniref:Uncharacterized protein n=1 Tax=Ramazzottius varieornatus TaxID=947166 RepID=A0A1D1W2M9_RAMVA|nr:hypothetical protein RvY_16893 [Ramazzottius varieornatus]
MQTQSLIPDIRVLQKGKGFNGCACQGDWATIDLTLGSEPVTSHPNECKRMFSSLIPWFYVVAKAFKRRVGQPWYNFYIRFLNLKPSLLHFKRNSPALLTQIHPY